MKKGTLKITLLAALLPAAVMPGYGWYGSWQSIKDTARTIKSVKASFTQRKHMKILARPFVSRGIFLFRAPRSLRWEYREPVKSILLMHNGSMARYVSDSSGEMVRDSSMKAESMQVVMNEITGWLKGNFTGNDQFRAELKHGGSIILRPREASMTKIISRIELRLSRRPGVIQSVKIVESRNSYTVITFHGVRINTKIDTDRFRKR